MQLLTRWSGVQLLNRSGRTHSCSETSGIVYLIKARVSRSIFSHCRLLRIPLRRCQKIITSSASVPSTARATKAPSSIRVQDVRFDDSDAVCFLQKPAGQATEFSPTCRLCGTWGMRYMEDESVCNTRHMSHVPHAVKKAMGLCPSICGECSASPATLFRTLSGYAADPGRLANKTSGIAAAQVWKYRKSRTFPQIGRQSRDADLRTEPQSPLAFCAITKVDWLWGEKLSG
jgi:hypothetical protein